MKKVIALVAAILWVAVLMSQSTYAQAVEDRKEPPELEAVLKMVKAEGRPDKLGVRTASQLGLDIKEPIPGKNLRVEHYRGVSTFSFDGKVWVGFVVYKNGKGEVVRKEEAPYAYSYWSDTDGVLRGAVIWVKNTPEFRSIPLADAAEGFAAEKAFWKEYVSKARKP